MHVRFGWLCFALAASATLAQESGRESARRELERRYQELTGKPIPAERLEEAMEEVDRLVAGVPAQVARRFAAEDAKREKVGTLAEPFVFLQVRSGAGGGNPNRIDMVGDRTAYVGEVVADPIEFARVTDLHERSKAYAKGGFIPAGKVFVIEQVTYRGFADGDSNGHGEFIVHAGPETIVSREDEGKEISATWEGRIRVLPGQESTVYVEVANSSAGEARFDGRFEDLGDDEAEGSKPVPESAELTFDPRRGTSVRSERGHIAVAQGEDVLWEGTGRSASTRIEAGAGHRVLVIVVDGVEVARIPEQE